MADISLKDDTEVLANDILYGARAIAEFLFGDPDQRGRVYHLCANRQIPHFRFGVRLSARRSTLREWMNEQERTGSQSMN
jgi:hypothetical protein